MASISDLLERFPNGFAVTPNGQIFEVVKTTRSISDLVDFDLEEIKGGYLIVSTPLFKKGDEKFVPKEETLDEYEMRNFLKKGRVV